MPEQSIFNEAVEKNGPAARAAYLDQACAGDGALRRRIERLLARHDQSGSFMEPANHPAATDPGSMRESPGELIGSYKLLEQIGEGGMGLVFVAEQQQPLRRKVALKVIKPGMDTREVIARFEAERQALALMDHLNIARVFDGGATDSGLPYFVMELVRGVAITDYCDQNQLTTRQRLELFVPVCHAVQHAHQKGIIHRDIKPSNILITLDGAEPVVKVIDFGVAKAIGAQLTEKSIYTRFRQMLGTPLYMSPEQSSMSGLDIDTRTDIFSLGVLLYELLTGMTPFDKERLRDADFDEIRRVIREVEPPKPSTRISTLGAAATTLSAQRGSDPRRLSQLLRGELDWIVMKALEKDRERRYGTADALAADVEHYLGDEPVSACPPSAIYRLRKFARRNKPAFAAAALLAGVALLTVVVLAAGNVRIQHEKELKELALGKEREALGRMEAALTLAGERAEKIEQDLRRLNAGNALLQRGRWFADSGQWARARADLNKAVESRPENSTVWYERGEFYARLGLLDLAGADYAQAFKLQKPGVTRQWFCHALLCLNAGDADGLSEVCRLAPAQFGAEQQDVQADNEIVRACAMGPISEADLAWALQAARTTISQQGEKCWNLTALGMVYYRSRKYAEAITELRKSLNAGDWLAGCHTNSVLAMACQRSGQTQEAREALTKAEQTLDGWSQAWLTAPAGSMPVWWLDWLPCQLLYREAKTLLEGSPPGEDPRHWAARGRAMTALRRDDDAQACYARAFALAPGDLVVRFAALPQTSDLDRRTKLLAELDVFLQRHPQQPPASVRTLAQQHFDLGEGLCHVKRDADARRAYGRAAELAPDFKEAWEKRGFKSNALDQYSDAIDALSQVIKLDPNHANSYYGRGFARSRLNQVDMAMADGCWPIVPMRRSVIPAAPSSSPSAELNWRP